MSERPDLSLPMNIEGILDILPHRYPFLLVDRVLELVPGERITALKNVTINEPFFVGHFPGHAVMPGVLIIEGMAQAGGILLVSAMEDRKEKVPYFLGIDEARFRKPIVPGDQIRFEIEVLRLRKTFCKVEGKALVDGKVAAQAVLTSGVVDR